MGDYVIYAHSVEEVLAQIAHQEQRPPEEV